MISVLLHDGSPSCKIRRNTSVRYLVFFGRDCHCNCWCRIRVGLASQPLNVQESIHQRRNHKWFPTLPFHVLNNRLRSPPPLISLPSRSLRVLPSFLEILFCMLCVPFPLLRCSPSVLSLPKCILRLAFSMLRVSSCLVGFPPSVFSLPLSMIRVFPGLFSFLPPLIRFPLCVLCVSS